MPKQKQPKISILVPCYNVEKYLPQCLDSIVGQTLRDIEIIVINDGSKDSTLDIIKSYAARDDRIKIIDKENEGYGKSMNRGLDAATGEYVGIVESDDWIDADMFESLVKIADENNVDVVKSNFYRYTTTDGEKNDLCESLPSYHTDMVINPREKTDVFFSSPAIWSAIYKRDFLVKNNIRFLESAGASFQDTGFNFKVFACTTRAYLTTRAWLHYRCDNENSSVKSTGKVFCVCDEYDEIERFFRERGELNTSMHKLISAVKISTYIWNLDRLGGDAREQFAHRFETELKSMLAHKYIDKRYIEPRFWFRILAKIHNRNIWYKFIRTMLLVTAPICKVRIRGRKKLCILFGTFFIKLADVPPLTLEK